MSTQISPGGSIFPYYYKGGEIHCLKFGNYFADEEALLTVMHAEEEFISRPNRRLSIWVDLYETQLTDNVLVELMQSMFRARHYIIKLALVGCSSKAQRRMHQLGKKLAVELTFPVKYFRDPEIAKTWLVSESG